MSFCLNPACRQPQNADDAELCAHCGAVLLLRKRYRAIAPLGHGGFGRTFLAIDEKRKAKPRCVIKQFLPVSQTPAHLKKAKALFKAEATRLKELGHHPQIPSLLAHINQDDQQYLVQEFIDGKNLEQELHSQGAFTEEQVRHVLTSLLPVLDFIHAQDVIHRDIKPANILWVSAAAAQAGAVAKTAKRRTRKAAPVPPVAAPVATDWSTLLQALARETAHRFRDFALEAAALPAAHSSPTHFSRLMHQQLLAVSMTMEPTDYARCQQFAEQFASYENLSGSQRQYLVADASRSLYEMRRRYTAPAVATSSWLILVRPNPSCPRP